MPGFFKCLIGCCLLFPVAGSSQATYEQGYFVDRNNRKTVCLIKPEAWSARGSLTYVFSYNEQPQTKPLAEISEVAVDGIFNLKRAQVQIDISGDESPLISYTQEPEWHREEVFLWTLVAGNTSLYLYEGGGLRRFFYRKGDNNFEQLIYKKYRTTSGIELNESFKRTLFEKINCSDSAWQYFESLRYTEQALVNHFVAENQCAGTTAQVYPRAHTSVPVIIPDISEKEVVRAAEKLTPPGEPVNSSISEQERVRYFGLEVNPLLRQIINLNPNSTPTNNPFGIQFASNASKTGRGFNMGLTYSRTRFNDDNNGVQRENISRDIAFRFGYERKQSLGKRWIVLHGYDLILGGGKARTETSDQVIGDVVTETTANFWGVGPRAGIIFLISDRVTLGTEATYYLRYVTDKTKLTGAPETKTRTSEFELTVPVVLILSIRF